MRFLFLDRLHIHKGLRIIAATIMGVTMVAVALFSFSGCTIRYEEDDETQNGSVEQTYEVQHYIRFTYTDEAYTPYLQFCAQSYERVYNNIHILLNLVDPSNYVEGLSEGSADDKTRSDLYLIDNATLGTAYLAGLTSKNTNEKPEAMYSEGAIRACSYGDSLVAYPLTFKTSIMVYNKDYVRNSSTIKTFEDIISFSGTMFGEDGLLDNGISLIDEEGEAEDAEPVDYSKLEIFLECNLSDIFLNYSFIGGTISVGGENGSDETSLNFYNTQSVQAAEQYKSVVDYFSISKTRSYEDVLNRFLEGKSAFAILSTDSLTRLEPIKKSEPSELTKETEENDTADNYTTEETAVTEEAAATEENAAAEESAAAEETSGFNYGVLTFPDYSNKLATSPLSISNVVAVNPFSTNQALATDFANYVTYTMKDYVYEYTGMMSACNGVMYQNAEMVNILDTYSKSTPKNKLLLGEQVYPMLEIALHNILAGESATDELKNVEEYMQNQYKK